MSIRRFLPSSIKNFLRLRKADLLFLLTPLRYVIYYLLVFHRRPQGRDTVFVLRDDHLGDFICSMPLLRQMKDVVNRQDKRLVMLVSTPMREIVSRSHCCDEVLDYSLEEVQGSFMKRIRLLRSLRECSVDIAINFVALARNGWTDYLIRATLPRKSFALDPRRILHYSRRVYPDRTFHNLLYSQVLPYDRGRMLLENEAQLASVALNCTIEPRLGDLDCFRPFSQSPELSGIGEYCIVVPGGCGVSNRWPPEKFLQVVDRLLAENQGLTVVLSGVRNEREMCEEIRTCSQCPDRIINVCGKTDFPTLCGDLEGASFVITNDTGTVHLAGKLGCRTVCIQWSGLKGVFGPQPLYTTVVYVFGNCQFGFCGGVCRQPDYCIQEPYACVRTITCEQVFQALRQVFR